MSSAAGHLGRTAGAKADTSRYRRAEPLAGNAAEATGPGEAAEATGPDLAVKRRAPVGVSWARIKDEFFQPPGRAPTGLESGA